MDVTTYTVEIENADGEWHRAAGPFKDSDHDPARKLDEVVEVMRIRHQQGMLTHYGSVRLVKAVTTTSVEGVVKL